MNRAKLTAISGICSAVCVGCLALASYVQWVMLICAAIATVACALPTLMDGGKWIYSVIILIVSGVLGMFVGIANVTYVAPIAAFCMPFGIVKAYGESVRVTASIAEPTVLEDPFDSKDDKQVVAVNVDGRLSLPRFVKWILYYVLLEVALGFTALFSYLFTRDFFMSLVESKLLYWLIAAAQLVVVPYDLLIRGCFVATLKIMRKAHIS